MRERIIFAFPPIRGYNTALPLMLFSVPEANAAFLAHCNTVFVAIP